jgi:hypothetical protein
LVNKINWQKIGRVAEPGRYMFAFGWLTVTAEDLAIWEQYPDATFTLVTAPSAGQAHGNGQTLDLHEELREEFHLGAFELPAGS